MADCVYYDPLCIPPPYDAVTELVAMHYMVDANGKRIVADEAQVERLGVRIKNYDADYYALKSAKGTSHVCKPDYCVYYVKVCDEGRLQCKYAVTARSGEKANGRIDFTFSPKEFEINATSRDAFDKAAQALLIGNSKSQFPVAALTEESTIDNLLRHSLYNFR